MERTNAQAQRAWITDLRPIAPNKERKPWRPTRGVGTSAASPRHANMGHDESVQMKKEHDSVYRRAQRAAGAGPTLSFAERMQADIARRQGQGEGQGQAESPKGGEAKTPERKQRPKPRPVAEQAAEGGGSRRRQPSKRSPPRPKRSRSPLQIGSLPAAAAAAGEAEAATTRVALSGEMSREEQ